MIWRQGLKICIILITLYIPLNHCSIIGPCYKQKYCGDDHFCDKDLMCAKNSDIFTISRHKRQMPSGVMPPCLGQNRPSTSLCSATNTCGGTLHQCNRNGPVPLCCKIKSSATDEILPPPNTFGPPDSPAMGTDCIPYPTCTPNGCTQSNNCKQQPQQPIWPYTPYNYGCSTGCQQQPIPAPLPSSSIPWWQQKPYWQQYPQGSCPPQFIDSGPCYDPSSCYNAPPSQCFDGRCCQPTQPQQPSLSSNSAGFFGQPCLETTVQQPWNQKRYYCYDNLACINGRCFPGTPATNNNLTPNSAGFFGQPCLETTVQPWNQKRYYCYPNLACINGRCFSAPPTTNDNLTPNSLCALNEEFVQMCWGGTNQPCPSDSTCNSNMACCKPKTVQGCDPNACTDVLRSIFEKCCNGRKR